MSHVRQQRVDRFEAIGTKVGVTLVVIAPIAMVVAIALGAAEVFPYEHTVPVALTAFCAPVGLAILLGAVGGMYVLGGWSYTPFGVLFTAGFAGLVLGLTLPHQLLRDGSVAALGVCGGVFYYLGARSGRAPASALAMWGNPTAMAGGVLAAAIGYRTGVWPALLFGVLAVSCGIGGLLGRRSSPRISP